MKNRTISLLATLITWASVGAQIQSDSTRTEVLDEVVVTDSKFELKRQHSGKTVIKINRAELERNQGRSLAEIINTKSGIEITSSRGRQGEVLGVFARGGRGRQVLILLDGVRISDPSSFSQEYDLRLLSLSALESVEIIKGAASTLYGTNAATAVINIKTKAASQRKIALSLETSFGTNQTSKEQQYNLSDFSNAVHLNGTLQKFNYSVRFANSYTDGISSLVSPENEEDPFSRITTDVKLGYAISDKLSMAIYGNQTKMSSDYDESFGLLDAPYNFSSEQKRAGVTGTFTYPKGEVRLNAAFTDYFSENVSAFPGTFEGSNYVVDVYNKYDFNNSLFAILGLNFIKDETVFGTTQDFTLVDPYANLVYIAPFGLNINSGFRLNNHSEYGFHVVYHVNPSYTIGTEQGYLKVLSSLASSYITPSLTQLFGNFGANPDLEPETNRTIEGGLEYATKNGLRVSALYFNRKEEDLVIFDNNAFQYFNADSTIDSQGAEVELHWNHSKAFRFEANYTFTERKGDNAIRIPKHKFNASAGYLIFEKTLASLSYSYTGERLDTDFSTFSDVSLDPFSLIGLYVSHQWKPNLKLFLNADNLLNEEYSEIIGFSTRGRNLRLGLSLNL